MYRRFFLLLLNEFKNTFLWHGFNKRYNFENIYHRRENRRIKFPLRKDLRPHQSPENIFRQRTMGHPVWNTAITTTHHDLVCTKDVSAR